MQSETPPETHPETSAETLQDESAHLVPLPAIMSDYKGRLAGYVDATGARNVVITMDVEIDVAGRKRSRFYVALGVTIDFETPEALVDEVMRECPSGHEVLFAWVPVHLFGSDDFGVMIDEIGVGENLQNGLVGEIIEKADVEAAVTMMAEKYGG
jgi:hypothetical protein